MPNPYPKELRERAVRAYESRTDTYQDVAARFAIGPATLMRWVQRQRDTGTVDPLAKAGGWESPVDWSVLKRLIDQRPDQTCEELTRAYNRVAPHGRVPASGEPSDGEDTWSKKTLAAGGTGPRGGRSRARRLPGVGPTGRCPPSRVSR
jgi:transposase-like protein